MRAKYPVRKWLGKYEAWLYHLYGRRSMLYNDKYLERFFSKFPEASGLEQFGTPDIFEYQKWRKSEGATDFKIGQEIKCVEKFYRYLIEDQALPLSNPGKPFIKQNPRVIYRRKKDNLRLEEYKRLLEVCLVVAPRLRGWIIRTVAGERIINQYMSHQKAGALLKQVAIKAGMPHINMRYIKRSVREGLWRKIIKDWSYRILADSGDSYYRNPHRKETELPGDPFAHVDVAAPDEGTTVSDTCEDEPIPVAD